MALALEASTPLACIFKAVSLSLAKTESVSSTLGSIGAAQVEGATGKVLSQEPPQFVSTTKTIFQKDR